MRTTVAIVLAIVMLYLGFHALGMQSQDVKPEMNNNSSDLSKDTYNLTNGVFGGVAGVTATALTWFGVAAVVTLGLGVLLGAWAGGGR